MKILHYSPGLRPGSISQLAADLSAGLQDAGYQNVVVSPSNEMVESLKAAGVMHCPAHHIAILSVWEEFRRMRRLLRKHKPDIVLSYTPQATRLVWWASHTIQKSLRPKLISVLTGFPRGWLWKRALRHSTAIVTISKYLRKTISARFNHPHLQGTWAIPYGVHEKLCHPLYLPTPEWRMRWHSNHDLPSDVIPICIPCPISPVHGLHLLPEIIKRLKQNAVRAHFFIVGDTAAANQSYLNSLRVKYEQEEIEDSITWLGMRHDLRDVLSSCYITLSLATAPASHDRAILEALSLGRLVIGFDHGAVGEMLDTFLPEGRIRPMDIPGIVDTICQWLVLKPDTHDTVPYPYRFLDTIRSFSDLCNTLCGKEKNNTHN